MPHHAASACPPSGPRTPPPGSPGPTTPKTGPASSSPSPGSTAKSSATSRGGRRPHPRQRRPPPKRRATQACSAATAPTWPASTSTTGAPTASGCATPAPSSSSRRRSETSITDWHFNAWAKYDNHLNDDQHPHRRRHLYGMPERNHPARGQRPPPRPRRRLHRHQRRRHPPHHRRVPPLRSPAAQPRHLQIEQLEQAFREHLGIDQVLWLNRGCAGDDTHGHVDDITRFVAPNTILTVRRTQHRRREPPAARRKPRTPSRRPQPSCSGQPPFHIKTLPMPAPVIFEGERLPASYANFYIANGLVLVPTFNDPNDRIALNALAECFPRPHRHRHPLHRLHLGPRRPPLHDPTGTRLMSATMHRQTLATTARPRLHQRARPQQLISRA